MLTAQQSAARLGISVRTLRRRCAEGEFPAPANTVKKRPLVWRPEDIDALASA
jgi:predicted DNA-binding transcriptional regulator AlpA